MSFPTAHRTKLHSTNPIERLNGEIKRRTEVVGIFPNEAAIVRLFGAILLEQNDEWAVQRARYMTLETIGRIVVAAGVGNDVTSAFRLFMLAWRFLSTVRPMPLQILPLRLRRSPPATRRVRA